MKSHLDISAALPADAAAAVLVGPAQVAGTRPVQVQVRPDGVFDL
jgi:hypothetical protein